MSDMATVSARSCTFVGISPTVPQVAVMFDIVLCCWQADRAVREADVNELDAADTLEDARGLDGMVQMAVDVVDGRFTGTQCVLK